MVLGKAEAKVATCRDCRYSRSTQVLRPLSTGGEILVSDWYCPHKRITVDPDALRHCDYYMD